jgi:hypothetical protein
MRRPGVVPPDAGLIAQLTMAFEQLGAVVADNRVRTSPSPVNNVVQLPRNASAGDLGLGN